MIAIIPTVAAAEDTLAFRIKDARITESSGLAVDPGRQSLLDHQRFGRSRSGVRHRAGRERSRAPSTSAPNRVDVEAIAVHKDRLYVADIGDNNAQRSSVRVFYFSNPRANGLTVSYHAYDFRYPDGPHNAETLLVNDSGPAVHRDEGQRRCRVRGTAETGSPGCQ